MITLLKASGVFRQGFNRILCHQRSFKEIVKTEDENAIRIKGIATEMTTDGVNTAAPCPISSRNLQITPDDVLILLQFVTSDGSVLEQHETGLNNREYYKIKANVLMAQRSGLLPNRKVIEDEHIQLKGTPFPKLERHLTRYPIGSRNLFKGRGNWYRQRWYMLGDRRTVEDAPRISNKNIKTHH